MSELPYQELKLRVHRKMRASGALPRSVKEVG